MTRLADVRKVVLQTDEKEKVEVYSVCIQSGEYVETREYRKPYIRGTSAEPKRKAIEKAVTRRRDSIFRSRKRLVRKVLSNSVGQKPLFFTFTYASNMCDRSQAVSDTKALIDSLRVLWSKIEYVYVLERQQRGAWHTHMLIFGYEYLDVRAVRAIWQECIQEKARVHVVATNNAKHTAFYLAKYMGKDDGLVGMRSYTCSPGLKKPVEIINYHERNDLVFPKGIIYERHYFIPQTENFTDVTIYYDDKRNLSWV